MPRRTRSLPASRPTSRSSSRSGPGSRELGKNRSASQATSEGPPMALGTFWALILALAGVSAAILAALLYVYGRNARHIRSKFTLGLVLFAALLLIQNVAGMWIYMSMNDAGMKADAAVPLLVPNGTGAGGR